jgi:hypothetical protein
MQMQRQMNDASLHFIDAGSEILVIVQVLQEFPLRQGIKTQKNKPDNRFYEKKTIRIFDSNFVHEFLDKHRSLLTYRGTQCGTKKTDGRTRFHGLLMNVRNDSTGETIGNRRHESTKYSNRIYEYVTLKTRISSCTHGEKHRDNIYLLRFIVCGKPCSKFGRRRVYVVAIYPATSVKLKRKRN